MSKTYLTLEEAENIVNNMYQKRWEECGVDDGNTIHMGNLDKLHYSELERASILLLRIELRLKRENKKYKEVIDKVIDLLDNHQNNLYSKQARETLDDDIELILKLLKEVE